MQIYAGEVPDLPKQPRGIALGFFDGLHRGHSDLIRTLLHACGQRQLPAAVLTFSDHPDRVLRADRPFDGYLMTLEERQQELAALGVDELLVFPFDQAFSRQRPEAFLELLFERLQAQVVVIGPDYRFGNQGAGDAALLQDWAARHKRDLVVVPEVSQDGSKIASSRIRRLIRKGAVRQAASLMGRPYSLTGTVASGRGLGRGMGFPTANVALPAGKVVPAYGVYVSRARVGQETWPAITNIGLRPTVSPDEHIPSVETYLFEADLDLYGRQITVELLDWKRPEATFHSLFELGQAVQADLTWARDWHRRAEQGYERLRIKGVPVRFLYSDRFAAGAMHLVFRQQVETEGQLACNALLVRLLTASCRRYPDRVQMARALDALYGASLHGSVDKQGDVQVLVLSASALVRWEDQPSPLQAACELLLDALLAPDLDEDGFFQPALVESERKSLLLAMAARENDRLRQAYTAALKAYCGTSVTGLAADGTLDAMQQVSPADLQAAYRALLEEMELTVYIGGAIDRDLFQACTQKLEHLPESERVCLYPGRHPASLCPEPQEKLTVHKDTQQARLVLIYDGLPPYYGQRQALLAALFNSLLGGDVHSLLFRTVREEKGLAYQVFSMRQRFLSALVLLAGVSLDQVDEALAAMVEQVDRIRQGRFDPGLLERSRMMLRSSIEGVSDNLSDLLSAEILAQATGRRFNRQESLALLDALKAEDVQALAQALRLRTTVVLTGQTPEEAGP